MDLMKIIRVFRVCFPISTKQPCETVFFFGIKYCVMVSRFCFLLFGSQLYVVSRLEPSW